MVLAEHFERGGDAAAAGRHYLRAAEQALRGNDAETAIARAQRGLAADIPDEERAALLGLLCEAYVWRGNPIAAAEHGEKVLGLATPGSARRGCAPPCCGSATPCSPSAPTCS